MYSDAQLAALKETLRDYNHFCGYAYNMNSGGGPGAGDGEDNGASAFF